MKTPLPYSAGKKSGPPPRSTIKDSTGVPVPVEIQEAWLQTYKVKHLIQTADTIKSCVKFAAQKGDKIFLPLDINAISALVEQLKDELKLAIPYAVCPECNGVNSEPSCICKGRGYLSEFYWTAVDENLKKITGRNK